MESTIKQYTEAEINKFEAEVEARIAYYKANPQEAIQKVRDAARRKRERTIQVTAELNELRKRKLTV